MTLKFLQEREMGMRKKDLRVVGKPSAEGPYVLLDSPIPPNNSNIRLPAATSAALARSQFHLTLIRRNTGIAWMREGSLPGTSKQSTGLFSVLLCASQQFTGLLGFTR